MKGLVTHPLPQKIKIKIKKVVKIIESDKEGQLIISKTEEAKKDGA